MRIISLTSIGNEEEIIESFVRYNSQFIDKMYFVSSCCIDNTLEILKKLKSEGINLEVFLESDISFEQRILDNKYLRMLAQRNDSDVIIPLDADEFLGADKNPRDIIEKLLLDKVYTILWKNYAISEEDDKNELFIPKRLQYVKENYAGNQTKKVIIPTKLIDSHRIVIETGHHDVFGSGIEIEALNDLFLAHYPVTSLEQYYFKIYSNSIKYIIWTNRGNNEAPHIYRQVARLKKKDKIFEVANGYGIDDTDNVRLSKQPLDLQFCDQRKLEIRYGEFISNEILGKICAVGQLMAIKAYKLQIKQDEITARPSVLIYGTGYKTQYLFNSIPDGLVNIKAYIESDELKKYRMYNGRLVISPREIKFFEYDRIVIPSNRYYEEMKKALIDSGVEIEKICGTDYLMDICLEDWV